MFGGVSYGEVRSRSAGRFIEFTRAAVEGNQRRAGFLRRDFDVLPGDAAAPPGLQSFQRRFFCRKARGIMLRGGRATRFAVSALGISEHPFGEPGRALDGFADTANFDNVDSDGDNHRRDRC